MKKTLDRDTIINIGFYGGLAVKAIFALIEFIGGSMMIGLSHERLNWLIWLIALPELRDDPNDLVMNYLVEMGQNLSISSQQSVAIYMLLHGTMKLAVIWLLWTKKLWAYPIAVAMFGLFVGYEIFSYIHNHSALMLPMVIFDVAIIVMIILEYLNLKAETEKMGG